MNVSVDDFVFYTNPNRKSLVHSRTYHEHAKKKRL